MENFYLAVVMTGSIFSALYCLIFWVIPRERLIFHRMVISALLVLMKVAEFIFGIILDKNTTSAVIFAVLFILVFAINVMEYMLSKKNDKKEAQK